MPTASKKGAAGVKSRILSKIAKETSKKGRKGAGKYQKNPSYGKGGLYGKGAFGKSDPSKGSKKPTKKGGTKKGGTKKAGTKKVSTKKG